MSSVIVVGGGCFGASAALELLVRGFRVTLVDCVDPGDSHHLAASTDSNKLIRPDYGDDVFYSRLMIDCMNGGGRGVGRYAPGWRNWNAFFGGAVFHETGILFLEKSADFRATNPNGFTSQSLKCCRDLGLETEVVLQRDIKKKYPAWNSEEWKSGYLSKNAGWAYSGLCVSLILKHYASMGGKIVKAHVSAILYAGEGQVCVGVRLKDGSTITADHTVVTAGAWTPHLLPFLYDVLNPTAHVVFHIVPPGNQQAMFDDSNGRFPAFALDTPSTGYYGFPIHPETGCVKVGFHGVGYPLGQHQITEALLTKLLHAVQNEEETRMRQFLKTASPLLAKGTIQKARVCLYCDSFDSHFIIDQVPQHPGLVVATGDSGHALKFTPMLGVLIADALQGKRNAYTDKFKMRKRKADAAGYDTIRIVESELIEQRRKLVEMLAKGAAL